MDQGIYKTLGLFVQFFHECADSRTDKDIFSIECERVTAARIKTVTEGEKGKKCVKHGARGSRAPVWQADGTM